MTKKDNILIIGAGLCGSLLALRLGQRGYNVRVIEMRPDLRKIDISAGRSINLAFSDRGIKAMHMVGIQDKVEPLCIPMNGRMLHDRDGNTVLSNYSGRDGNSQSARTCSSSNSSEISIYLRKIANSRCKYCCKIKQVGH